MTVSFRIPYPATKAGKSEWSKLYGLNAYWRGKHWSKRKSDVAFWHQLTAREMDRQGVRKTPLRNPVILTFYHNDRLDCSNHAAIEKMIEDALHGRVIVNDDRRWVRGKESYFHDEDYILVVAREV
ncbi:MAG: hypothetical protein IJX47_02355 [Clostridia bacterium]|nr:hypothetical protein [Clostridia bacterium]